MGCANIESCRCESATNRYRVKVRGVKLAEQQNRFVSGLVARQAVLYRD